VYYSNDGERGSTRTLTRGWSLFSISFFKKEMKWKSLLVIVRQQQQQENDESASEIRHTQVFCSCFLNGME
jgi:hypothetical protein